MFHEKNIKERLIVLNQIWLLWSYVVLITLTHIRVFDEFGFNYLFDAHKKRAEMSRFNKLVLYLFINNLALGPVWIHIMDLSVYSFSVIHSLNALIS